MELENKNEKAQVQPQEQLLFRYRLTDAWCRPISSVSISETEAGGVLRVEGREIQKMQRLPKTAMERIREVIRGKEAVFDEAQEVDEPDIFDGFINMYNLYAGPRKKADILCYNFGAWFEDAADREPGEISRKTRELMELHREVAGILVECGVEKKWMRHGFERREG